MLLKLTRVKEKKLHSERFILLVDPSPFTFHLLSLLGIKSVKKALFYSMSQ